MCALPLASLRDTVAIGTDVLAPSIAKGPILRRPRMVGLAERFDLDRRSVERMRELRTRYGSGPLRLRVPGQPRALVLDRAHVREVLAQSPEPFATASREKRAALAHFEPRGALISHGAERADRRRFNEAVLEHERPAHALADPFLRVVAEEADALLEVARHRGVLDWEGFSAGWFRVVRRVVFGDAARDDEAVRALIDTLRAAGNWAWFHPTRRITRRRFFARIESHLARAEPGSLSAVMARTPETAATAPSHQVPQWLFAFDPAGMSTFRALAALAAHPDLAARGLAEARAHAGPERARLVFLRAAVLDTLRLWPTTPLVLRETTRETVWERGTLPAGTQVVVFAPFFHRDPRHVQQADRFAPDLWLDGSSQAPGDEPGGDGALIPFSAGPAICPGRHLVLLLTSAMLAALLDGTAGTFRPPARLDPSQPMPGTLDLYTLRLALDA